MMSRKKFLQHTALAAAGLSWFDWLKPAVAAEFRAHLERVNEVEATIAARDEEFWQFVRTQFSVSSSVINLNNGGVSPQPFSVQQAHIRNYQYCNEAPTYHMWRILDQGREPLRARLAAFSGVSADEIAINRNATEGLNTIIFGLDLQPGDEVVLSKYDYPNMMQAWKQRARRDKIKLNWIDFDFPMEDENQIIKKYAEAITSRTRVVHITHIINWTGQILPAQKIAEIARNKGCEVIMDIAHSFAHLHDRLSDLQADYAATSLHKWLCAPFGTGLMYIRKDKIGKIWPLLSAPESMDNDIRKFEVLGTRSFAAEMAIAAALDFHLLIGSERKEERLRFLKNYWCEQIKTIPRVRLLTSLNPRFSCGIAAFSLENLDASEIEKFLFDKKKIHVTTIKHEKLNCIRVTPHVYTSLQELDMLAEAIYQLAQR